MAAAHGQGLPRPLPHIAVLGSLNMDLVAYVPRHPMPGETLTADAFATSPGGKGANQAVACAKLSRDRPPSSSSSSEAEGQERQEGASRVCYADFEGRGRAAAVVSMVRTVPPFSSYFFFFVISVPGLRGGRYHLVKPEIAGSHKAKGREGCLS